MKDLPVCRDVLETESTEGGSGQLQGPRKTGWARRGHDKHF